MAPPSTGAAAGMHVHVPAAEAHSQGSRAAPFAGLSEPQLMVRKPTADRMPSIYLCMALPVLVALAYLLWESGQLSVGTETTIKTADANATVTATATATSTNRSMPHSPSAVSLSLSRAVNGTGASDAPKESESESESAEDEGALEEAQGKGEVGTGTDAPAAHEQELGPPPNASSAELLVIDGGTYPSIEPCNRRHARRPRSPARPPRRLGSPPHLPPTQRPAARVLLVQLLAPHLAVCVPGRGGGSERQPFGHASGHGRAVGHGPRRPTPRLLGHLQRDARAELGPELRASGREPDADSAAPAHHGVAAGHAYAVAGALCELENQLAGGGRRRLARAGARRFPGGLEASGAPSAPAVPSELAAPGHHARPELRAA